MMTRRLAPAHPSNLAASECIAPFRAVAVLALLNSLGSGLLWNGTSFVTENDFSFSKVANLWLAIGLGVVYSLTALRSGRIVRALHGRLSTRGILIVILLVEGAGAWLAFDGVAGVVACGVITSIVGALLWPIVESYLTSGRHGPAMRSAIGGFNVVWMASTAAALVLMGPLLTTGMSRLALVSCGPLALFSLLALRHLPRDPARHGAAEAEDHVPASYQALLAASRVLLPVSYLFLGALGPLMPYIVDRIGIAVAARTPLTATWMVARLVVVLLLMRVTFWHGRAGTLVLGVLLLFGGFATVVLAPSVEVLALGLVALGAGQGTVYHATLYYSMAVGRAAVEASSVFEALVGLGYVLGPGAALVGQMFGGSSATVLAVSVAASLTLVPAMRPLARAWRAGAAA